MTLGPAARVAAMARLGESDVGESVAILLGYPAGQLAAMCVSIAASTPTEALILGANGPMRLHRFFNRTTATTNSRAGQSDKAIEWPFLGSGCTYEATEVMRSLRAGKLESDIMPLEENRSIMKTLDEIRVQVGVSYPTE
jgi:dihydrodiol dehydrogenase / D-xylose 1-dehydrogenase (NADP)